MSLASDFIISQENLKQIRKKLAYSFLHTIPRRVTFLHDDRINLNIHKNVIKNLDVDPTSETWFPNKYIEAEIKKN